jgi:hypothetical protein
MLHASSCLLNEAKSFKPTRPSSPRPLNTGGKRMGGSRTVRQCRGAGGEGREAGTRKGVGGDRSRGPGRHGRTSRRPVGRVGPRDQQSTPRFGASLAAAATAALWAADLAASAGGSGRSPPRWADRRMADGWRRRGRKGGSCPCVAGLNGDRVGGGGLHGEGDRSGRLRHTQGAGGVCDCCGFDGAQERGLSTSRAGPSRSGPGRVLAQHGSVGPGLCPLQLGNALADSGDSGAVAL